MCCMLHRVVTLPVPAGCKGCCLQEQALMPGVCLQHDKVNRGEVEKLVDGFPGQSIDFFGALRARVYDDRVRQFVMDTGIENIGKALVNRCVPCLEVLQLMLCTHIGPGWLVQTVSY